MKVLAIDSAMNGCLACVYDAGKQDRLLSQEKLEITRGQAEHLMPMVERVMNSAGIDYSALDLISVTNGPGAFTGMRIAISTAKAIALAAKKPIVGVSTMQAVLDSYLRTTKETVEEAFSYYAVVLETKRSDYYFQMFEAEKEATISNIKETMPAITASASEICAIISKENTMLVGDAVNRFMSECENKWPSHEITLPMASSIAKLGVRNYKENGEKIECKPVYLRPPEIGETKKTPRGIKS